MIQKQTNLDLAIVGGGAAGYFAAITCAEEIHQQTGRRANILILEKANQPLGKVKVSGGGRCNVTHAMFDPARLVQYYPRGGPELRGAFARFQPRDTVEWFERRGTRLKTEADGRIFPVTDSSQTIVDALVNAARKAGVAAWIKTRVEAIERTAEAEFRIRLQPQGTATGDTAATPEWISSRYVLLATGGERRMFGLATTLGHSIVPPVPSLFTFTVSDARIEGLAGVSVPKARVRLLTGSEPSPKQKEFEQEGPLLITHWGLSGPVILRLSAWGARWLFEHQYRAELEINWVPPLKSEAALSRLLEYKNSPGNARQKAANHDPLQRLPLRLWKRLVQAASISDQQNWGDASKEALRKLANELTQGRFHMQGKGPFKEEFVTCGGIPLDEVNLKTMESRKASGLYFAGEILNVDGLTGGFNFQNAWTTGWIAGMNIASRLAGESSGNS